MISITNIAMSHREEPLVRKLLQKKRQKHVETLGNTAFSANKFLTEDST